MTSRYPLIPVKYVTTYNDETLPEGLHSDTEIDYIEISDVDSQRGITNSTLVKFADAPSRARRKIRSNDVLVSTVRTYLRAIASAEKEHDGYIASTGFCVLRPTKVHPRYLKYVASSSDFVEGIIARSTGISYPAINATDLVRLPIPVPGEDEQRSIASFLDRETARIDGLIAKQERLIELLAEKRQATMTRAVTKGLDPTAPTKPSRVPWLGDIPSHWTALPLKWFSKLTTGITPSTANGDNFPDEQTPYPWVRPEDLNESGRPTEASKFLSADAWNGCRPIRANSVLVCCIGATLGKVGLIRSPAVTNQQITAIESEMDGSYLFAAMTAARQEIQAMSVGNTLPILNTSRLGMLSVPVPPAQEQLKIAEYVRAKSHEIDLLSSKCQSAIRILRERRSALISAAVTGKIDVREGVA